MTLIYKPRTIEGFNDALQAVSRDCRYNVRNDAIEYSPGWVSANDRNTAKLRFDIAEHVEIRKGDNEIPLLYPKDLFYDLRNAYVEDKAVDPFLEYLLDLDQIEVSSDDIEDRNLSLDRVFEDLFETPESHYYRHAARAIYLGAVWRAFKPGYKLDEITVLQGGQNVGKDSVIRESLPLEDWFTDALAFNASDKEKIEMTRGKVLVCASEMGGVTTTRDLEALKRWITTQRDRVRLAYRHDAEDYPRRFIVVGTTNADKPLPPDATGNRRWMVIPITRGAHVEPWMQERRQRFWQEAVALYRMGVKPNLPFSMKREQNKENEQLKRHDEQIEEGYYNWIDNADLNHPYQMMSIAMRVGLVEAQKDWVRAPKADQHRLRDCLIAHGWMQRKSKHAGLVRNWWYPPKIDTLSD